LSVVGMHKLVGKERMVGVWIQWSYHVYGSNDLTMCKRE
jgi:hypothetical protein